VVAKDIIKSYKSFFGSRNVVLRDISLDISRDEIFGILGPNGSGKTTLLSIFSTLIYPDSGSLTVLGIDARKSPGAIRRLINISTAKPNFPWGLTAEECLKYSAMLYGIHGPELKRAVDNSIEAFELGKYRDVQFDSLSTGLKQRLSLASA
jgi:ABC-2 type transport system ATP-binding protein